MTIKNIYSEYPTLKYCKIRKGTKKPFERDWPNKPYSWKEIQSHIKKEKNFGVLCGYGGVIVIDADTEELKDSITRNLPNTLQVKTGGGGTHFYYFCKEVTKKIVLQNSKKHFGEVQSFGSQVVGAGSIHPNGNLYVIDKDNSIVEISQNDLLLVIKPFMKEVVEAEKLALKETRDYGNSDINNISITQVMDTSGFKKASNGELYGSNKWHGSQTGMNTWINQNKNLAHCFRCNSGINVPRAIALNEGIINNCSDSLTKAEFIRVLEIAKDKYGLTAPKKTDLKTFIFDKSQLINKKTFSSHILGNGKFAFGLLLPRDEDITNKKDEVIGQKQVWRPVVITSDKRGLVVSKWLEKEYKVYYESTPQEMPLRWELEYIDTYLHKTPENVDGKNLANDISSQYKHYCHFRTDDWYNINSLWDIGTYFHQLFASFPLKEERGFRGTGKTKCMIISSYLTLNATEIMINPSESTLFRLTEEIRPTKYIDECEKLFKSTKFGMEADNRVELINASYSRNGVVPRQEKIGNNFITKWYHVYSPTRIGSIKGLFGATEDRAITQIHSKAADQDKRGELDPEDDKNNSKWQELRNKCYLFALQNWKEIQNVYSNFEVEANIKKRDMQLWKPLLVLAKVIDEKELLPKIIKFAEKYSKQKKIDVLTEGSYDYKLVHSLHEALKKSKGERIYLNEIRKQFNHFYSEAGVEGKEPKGVNYNKTVSSRLDKFGFKDLKDKDELGAYYELTKNVFNEIISPVTSDFSSDSSESSGIDDDNDNDNDEYDERGINPDEKRENTKNKTDESDGNDESDGVFDKKDSPKKTLNEDGTQIEVIKIKGKEFVK